MTDLQGHKTHHELAREVARLTEANNELVEAVSRLEDANNELHEFEAAYKHTLTKLEATERQRDTLARTPQTEDALRWTADVVDTDHVAPNTTRAHLALKAYDAIEWMAEEYAESSGAGGEPGPEVETIEYAKAIIAVARAALDVGETEDSAAPPQTEINDG